MRMLIIAGPYEADRLRREATSAGIESVAIEPSASLSSWIQATDPALILLVPGILHPDPTEAAARVKTAAQGRVPLLLVGDPADAEAFASLAEGFLARPVTEAALREQIRRVTGAEVVVATEEVPSGPVVAAAIATESSNPSSRPRPLRPLVAEGSGPTATATPAKGTTPAPSPVQPPRGRALFERMADLIDAAFDEEIAASARAADTKGAGRDDEESRVFVVDEGDSALSDEGPSARATLEAPGQGVHGDDDDETAGASDGRAATAPSGSGPASLPALVAGGVLGEGTPPLDLASVIGRLFLARASGRLVLEDRASGVAKCLSFEGGRAISLAWQGTKTPEHDHAATEEAAEELAHALFAWEPVTYRFGRDEAFAGEERALSVTPAALLVEGLRRKVPLETTLARLGGDAAVLRMRATADTAELLDEMGLGAEERRLTLFLDGVRTLGEVRGSTAASWSSLVAIARVLMVLDKVDVVTPARPDTPAARERDAALDRARVGAAHALVEEGDYFRVLGVGRAASREEIAAAHMALLRDLAPEALAPEVAEELAEQVAAIREVLDEGWRVLGDDERRRRYRAALEAEPLEASTAHTSRAPGARPLGSARS